MLYNHYIQSPKSYEFVFDSVMKSEKALKTFHKFLSEVEKSGEIIDFLQDVKKYKSWILDLYSDHNFSNESRFSFIGKTQEIIDLYIVEKSSKQINVPSNLISGLYRRIDEVTDITRARKISTERDRTDLQILQYDIFSDITRSILYTVKCDSFRRCVRSDIWMKFVEECQRSKESFSTLDNIITKIGEKHARYTLEDIKRPQIITGDFTFVSELCEDRRYWSTVEHKGAREEGIEVYSSDRSFIIPESRRDSIKDVRNKYQERLDAGLSRLKYPSKFVFYLDHHYERVLASLLSEELRSDTKTFKYTSIGLTDATHENPGSISVVMGMAMPFPFSNREVPCISSARREIIEGQEGALMIIRPYNDSHVEKVYEKSQRCRLIQCWSFVKIHENLTRVTMVLFMEFGGWLTNKHLQKALSSQQVSLIVDYKKGIEKTLTKFRDDGYPLPSNDLHLMDVYEQNNRIKNLEPSIYSRC